MQGNELFSKDWCELLFERRNKKYGAYVLRATTGQRYTVALGLVFAIFLLILIPQIVVWVLTPKTPPQKVDIVQKIARFEGIRIKEARPVRRPPVAAASQIAEEETPQKQNLPEKPDLSSILQPGELIVRQENLKELSMDSIRTLEDEINLELAHEDEQTDGILLDSIARYPTGIKSFMRWLHQTVIYPPDCVRRRVSGTVEVAFIVEPDGSIADPRILKSAGKELNHEVMRVIGLMPRWIPAKKHGHNIRSQVTLPVVFELSE